MNLFFLVGYDLDRSPWATRPRAILKAILAKGHSVTVVDLEEPRKTHPPIHPPLEKSQNLIHIRLKQRYWISLDAPLAVRAARRKIFPYLQQADVVHIQKPKILTWAIGRWAVELDKPIIYDWDDWEGTGGIRTGWNARKIDRIDAFFARFSKAIVAASRELKKLIHERYPDHAPLYDGPCGVDLEHFNPDRISDTQKENWRKRLGIKEERIILYHGQLEMGDPGTLLLKSLKNLPTRFNVKMLLVGGGKIQEQMVQKAAALGLDQKLIVTGYIAFQEIPILLSLADIAVALFPDNAYTRCKSPLKIYEAMAMRLPLIATQVGQAKEVLADCGCLVPPGKPQALTEAIEHLLDNPDEARQLGTAAREQAVKYHDWKNLAEMVFKLYTEK